MDKRLSELVRKRRREQGLTQSALAEQAGCTQSAISMFEAGRPEALADKTVARIVEILGIDLAATRQEGKPQTAQTVRKYCPTASCPSNTPYVVLGRLMFLPATINAPEHEPSRCRFCEEIMESRCPNPDCKALVEVRECCKVCGTPYVIATETGGAAPDSWADTQRERIRNLLQVHGLVTQFLNEDHQD